MNMFKRGLVGLLVLAFLGLNLPKAAFCDDALSSAKADKKNITRHQPKIMATPEKDIPMVQADGKEHKSKSSYVWIGLGAVVLLGLVAAAAGGSGGGGGGDGGNGDDNQPAGGDTGDITVGW